MVEYNHCCICGACFCIPSDDLLLSYINNSDYQKPITDDDVLWLSRFRILAKYRPQAEDSAELKQQNRANRDGRLNPCFLSGPGRFRRSKAEFLRGEMVGLYFGKECSSAKREEPAELLVMPELSLWTFVETRARYEEVLVFHQVCYEDILNRVLKTSTRNKLLNHEADPFNLINLHGSLLKQRIMGEKSNCGMFGPSSGDQDADVGIAGVKCGTRYKVDRLCDPVPVDWLSSYLTALSLQGNLDLSRNHVLQQKRSHFPSGEVNWVDSEPFNILPLDCILTILDLLSIREVLLLSLASPAVYQRLGNSGFWKRRVPKDMPWLWELDSDIVPNSADWRRVYFDLWNQCTHGHQTRLLGLVNRKRIWKICSSIVDRCLRVEPDAL